MAPGLSTAFGSCLGEALFPLEKKMVASLVGGRDLDRLLWVATWDADRLGC